MGGQLFDGKTVAKNFAQIMFLFSLGLATTLCRPYPPSFLADRTLSALAAKTDYFSGATLTFLLYYLHTKEK